MKFEIHANDNDTRGFYKSEVHFDTVEEAEEYCKRHSWTGEDYSIHAVIINGVYYRANPMFLEGLKVGLSEIRRKG